MLSARNRMRRSVDFTETVRGGVRGGGGTVVVHLNVGLTEGHPLVGFVVSKAVGNSPGRHRVQRQLRHLMRERVNNVPAGARLVVRALPAAAGQPSEALGADLDSALAAALRKVRR
ncbi:MAG TPA: ribonuclease P protein component [Actinomycetales bacterium]|nr:ribonuclease P protein component [Actinomycetales bacterium]